MYSISLVDRGNMSFALVSGMMQDLELYVGNRYSVLVMVFFAFYMYALTILCRHTYLRQLIESCSLFELPSVRVDRDPSSQPTNVGKLIATFLCRILSCQSLDLETG